MTTTGNAETVVLGCGALVRELRLLAAQLGGLELRFLPAPLHNRPERIPAAVRNAVVEIVAEADAAGTPRPRIVLGYADCGTGGLLDRAIAELADDGIEIDRLPGAHCYEFFAGSSEFASMMEEELGTFFLTDYLARHFDTLIWRAYRLEEHPELRNTLFGAYRRVVHLTQTEDPPTRARLLELAADAAGRLGLPLESRPTGLSPLREVLVPILGLPTRSIEKSEPCPADLN